MTPRQEIDGKAYIDLRGQSAHVVVDFFYPDFSAAEQPRVTIGLCHVRAADAITVRFDGERNGYVVTMDRTREAPGYMEVVESDCEVAFISAWNEENAPGS